MFLYHIDDRNFLFLSLKQFVSPLETICFKVGNYVETVR